MWPDYEKLEEICSIYQKSAYEKGLIIKEQEECIKTLKEENKKLKADTEHTIKFNNKIIGELKLENKKLKEKLDAFESSKFNTMALLEIQHPKTAREAENLLQVKKVFEKLYNDRLYCLEEENRNLKSDLEKFSEAYKRYRDYEKEELAESCYDLAREKDKLKEENRRLSEKNKIYSNALVQEKENNKKLKGEEIIKKLYTLIDNLTLIADNWIYVYSRDGIREYIEWLILWIQGKSDF